MTDSEIVEGFECCNNGWCDNRCPYYGREDIADCREQNGADLLDFTNRQQAEIERLRAHIQEGIDLAKQTTEMLERAIAEAVKEFAERLVRNAKSTKDRFLLDSLVGSVMKEMGVER